MNIYEKLTELQHKISVSKTKKNNFGGYMYRTVDGIYNAIKPLLSELKLSLIITTDLMGEGNNTFIKASCTFKSTEGDSDKESITSTAFAKIDFTRKGMSYDQMTGSAITYAVKYALSNLLLLEAEEDADAKDNTDLHVEKSSKSW